VDNWVSFFGREYWNEEIGDKTSIHSLQLLVCQGTAKKVHQDLQEECAWQHSFKTLKEAEEVINKLD
jgi:hypothetical protein